MPDEAQSYWTKFQTLQSWVDELGFKAITDMFSEVCDAAGDSDADGMTEKDVQMWADRSDALRKIK